MVARLRLPRIVELCDAPAPECGEYLLMARMIRPSQQVSPPVAGNKVKHLSVSRVLLFAVQTLRADRYLLLSSLFNRKLQFVSDDLEKQI